MAYAIDEGRVRFHKSAIRNADAATFVVLASPWARDASSVYFKGRKVPRARVGTFRVVSPRVAYDEKGIFFQRDSGDVWRTARDGSFDPSNVRVIETDRHTFILSRRVWLVTWRLVEISSDPTHFELLGDGYAKDRERVYWVQPSGQWRHVEEADAPTFTVDRAGARDRDGPFVAGVRDRGPLPIQVATDFRTAAEALIDRLWNAALPRWFGRFDSELPNDAPAWSSPSPPSVATPIPAHHMRLQGDRLRLTVGELSQEGAPSAMELLAGWLWGLARRKVAQDRVCVRILPRTDREIAGGSAAGWEPCLDLAFALSQLGCASEALMLLHETLRASHKGPQTGPDSPSGRAAHLFGSQLDALPRDVETAGSTTQSVMTIGDGRFAPPLTGPAGKARCRRAARTARRSHQRGPRTPRPNRRACPRAA